MDLNSKPLQQTVHDLIRPLAEHLGLELVEIEFIGRHRGAIIRIYVDSEKGVSLEDCGRLSREASDRFDQEEVFDQAYTLEVSSPGLDRPFRNRTNYERAVGKRIDVVLSEPIGKTTFLRGTLEDVGDARIVLRTEKDETLELGFDKIKRAHRTLEF